MSSEWSLVWPITTALRSLWKKSHTFPEKTLAHFLTPSPKIKKFTLKKFLIFFRKNNSYLSGLMLIKCKISYIPYTPGWLLIKHRIKQILITRDDCWFSLPNKLSKNKQVIKPQFHNYSKKEVFYTYPTLRKKTNFLNENSFSSVLTFYLLSWQLNSYEDWLISFSISLAIKDKTSCFSGRTP